MVSALAPRTFWVCVAAMAGACAHGNGSNGELPPVHDVPFASWQAIRPNEPTNLTGTSEAMSGAQAPGAGGPTATTMDLTLQNSGGMRVIYDDSFVPRLVTLSSAVTSPGSVTFDRDQPGQSVTCSAGACALASPTANGTYMDGRALGWNYQTFGVWNVLGNPTAWQVGVVTAGSLTPLGAVPATGSATFSGQARGFYMDATGNRSSTSADMSALVNFSTRTVGFATTNTTLTNLNTGVQTANTGLNLNGVLAFQPPSGAATSFTGTLTTQNSALTGGTTGFFYGPNAQEVGGTYRLVTPARALGANSTDLESMVGAYGGKR